mgnify:CR=1 FL=1
MKRRVVEIVASPGEYSGGSGGIYSSLSSERQVILFLTRQEILKVEDLIDERAGVVSTYTNTSFYPADVVNDPGTKRPTILQCSCNHRQKCQMCAQRHDDQYGLVLRPS